MRYFIKLAYDGSPFHGWQVQDNAHSVQQELESAMSTLLRHKIELTGCGRTDTGVHATCFYAHFDTPDAISDTSDFIYRLNCLLPKSIATYTLLSVPDQAHARFDAISRTYQYHIHHERNPFLEMRSYYRYEALNLDIMRVAFPILMGEHDFSCFSKTHTQVKTNMCNITYLNLEQIDHQIIFTITANRFLRGMVRAIMGTLLNISSQKINQDDLKNILKSKNRSLAGESVPPYALYLTDIQYPKTILSH